MSIKKTFNLKIYQAWLIILLTVELGCNGIMPSREMRSKPAEGASESYQQAPSVVTESPERPGGTIRKIGALPDATGYCPNYFQFVTDLIGWSACGNQLWQTSDGGQTWEQISAVDMGGDYVSFSFSNNRVGWCYSNKMIQQTEDGGYHWTRIPNPVQAEKVYINSVKFLKDGKTGWLAGSEWEPIPPASKPDGILLPSRTDGKNARRGIIYHTTDGGKHWQKQSAPIRLGHLVTRFYVSENDQIWALCDFDLLHLVGNMWKKVDFTKSNCANSQLLNALRLTDDADDYFYLTEINFSDSTNGWLSVGNSLLAKTTDGGQTWCDLLLPGDLREAPNEPTAFIELYFADLKKGWGLTRSGKLYRTSDGGTSWEKIQGDVTFSRMYFLNPHNGWLIAQKGLFKVYDRPVA